MTNLPPDDTNFSVDFDGMILIIGVEVSRTTIWRWVKAEKFPKPAKLAGTMLAWKRRDLFNWAHQQYEKRHTIHRAEGE